MGIISQVKKLLLSAMWHRWRRAHDDAPVAVLHADEFALSLHRLAEAVQIAEHIRDGGDRVCILL